MPLSEYEQRVLSQMEQQLRSDDPRLASTFTSEHRYSGRRLALGTLAILAGLGLLVAGVSTTYVLLGVLGFVFMLGGVMLAISRPKGTAAPGAAPGKPRKSPAGGGGGSSMMQRLEHRWDRRREDRGR